MQILVWIKNNLLNYKLWNIFKCMSPIISLILTLNDYRASSRDRFHYRSKLRIARGSFYLHKLTVIQAWIGAQCGAKLLIHSQTWTAAIISSQRLVKNVTGRWDEEHAWIFHKPKFYAMINNDLPTETTRWLLRYVITDLPTSSWWLLMYCCWIGPSPSEITTLSDWIVTIVSR